MKIQEIIDTLAVTGNVKITWRHDNCQGRGRDE